MRNGSYPTCTAQSRGLSRLFGPGRPYVALHPACADLGLSVEAIGDLLSLWRDRSRQSGTVKRLALDHVARLRAKIADLEAMASTLEMLAQNCAGDHRPACPILDDLEDEGASLGNSTGLQAAPVAKRPKRAA